MLRKRPVFWIGLLALAGLAIIATLIVKTPTTPATPAPAASAAAKTAATLEFLPSDLTEVKPHTLRQVLVLSGSLRAVNQAQIKAKVAGEVREVLVREGESVQSGQVLARIDAAEYQARLEQAKGSLQAARAQLAIATKARDTNQALVEKGFISKNAFDNASSQYDIARANLESAKGAVDLAQKALHDAVIRAPISGVVAARFVQPGEKVAADARLLDLVDLRQMELEVAVPTTDILHVALGQEVQVKLEGAPLKMLGRVSRINPATQAGSRSILTHIQIENPQRVLKAGMFGEAQLTLAKKENVLTVPQTAIQYQAGKPVVYAIENGVLQPKFVTLGMRGDDGEGIALEILDGLQQGMQIVKTNLGPLPAGASVKVAHPSPASAATAASGNPPTDQ